MSNYANSRPKYLDQLVANRKLTADGRDWLTLALDPFHDLNHQAAGFPDSDGSQTIVSCYQYQVDLGAPAGVVGNWDAHVFTMPTCIPADHALQSISADWKSAAPIAGAPLKLGPLTIITAAGGANLYPTTDHDVLASTTLPSLNSTDLASGVTRVIGLGYEVTNTTAEINKQGSVTSYRMPQYASATGAICTVNDAISMVASVPVVRWRAPPANTAEANLLKGTRTWDAASGVYATAVLNSVANPLVMVNNSANLYVADPYPNAPGVAVLSPTSVAIGNTGPAVSVVVPSVTQQMPYDTTGSMFTGLSNATTLTIKLKVYVERAPTYAEPHLAVLATPSAGYDVMALELYSQAISQLPVAVTVSENGAGDWFRGVVRVLKNVAGPLGNAINAFVPGAGLIGTAAQKILGVVDTIAHSKRPSVSVSKTIQPRATAATKQPKTKPAKKATRK